MHVMLGPAIPATVVRAAGVGEVTRQRAADQPARAAGSARRLPLGKAQQGAERRRPSHLFLVHRARPELPIFCFSDARTDRAGDGLSAAPAHHLAQARWLPANRSVPAWPPATSAWFGHRRPRTAWAASGRAAGLVQRIKQLAATGLGKLHPPGGMAEASLTGQVARTIPLGPCAAGCLCKMAGPGPSPRQVAPLDDPATRAEAIAAVRPPSWCPGLDHGPVKVWDTLADRRVPERDQARGPGLLPGRSGWRARPSCRAGVRRDAFGGLPPNLRSGPAR